MAVRRLAYILGAACFLSACGPGQSEPTLDEVRAIAAKYRDVNVAKAEGFTTDNKCVTAAMLGHPAALGAMGLHYVRRDLLGLPPDPPAKGARVKGTGTHVDFTQPAMLVYEPQADGSLVWWRSRTSCSSKPGIRKTPRRHASMGGSTRCSRTIGRPRSTRPTAGSRITSSIYGCSATIRRASIPRSIRM